MAPDIADIPQSFSPSHLGERVQRMLEKGQITALTRLLGKSNFADIAEVMEHHLSTEQAVATFALLSEAQAAQVLPSLDEDLQQACLESLSADVSSYILRQMAADDAVDILQEMDTHQSRKILEQMPLDEDTREIQHLMLEEPDTAAGIMSTDLIETHIDGTVGDALQLIRNAQEKDFVYYCYLIDEAEHLEGVVSLKQLVIHDDATPLREIATTDVKHLLIHFDQALAVNVFRKYYNLLAMPVVDEDNVLRGIITLDDIVDVIDEESSEELYRASGINLEEIDEKSLLTGPAIEAVKARIPWLSVSLFGQMLGSFIIANYETTVQAAVVAVSFMPMLTGLAGNMGTQSDTIAVRGLSLNLINESNFKEKLWRELKVALITGCIFGAIVGFFSFIFYHKVALTVLLATWIICSLLTTALLGMVLPYAYMRVFKQDPAGVGGPFITTTSDIVTFSLYLYILTLLLPQLHF